MKNHNIPHSLLSEPPETELAKDDPKIARQELLCAVENPAVTRDSLSSLSGRLYFGVVEPKIVVSLTYAPDKLIISPNAWATYINAIEKCCKELSLERLGELVLDDVNNEVIPRWLQVRVQQIIQDEVRHAVLFEDRQPNWDNPSILYRAPQL